jgi:hypothetical protein
MKEYKIGNINYLSQDRVVVSDGEITNAIDIYKVDTNSKSINDSVSNQATTTLVPLVNSIAINANGQTVTALSKGVTAKSIGTNAESGKLTSVVLSTLPNIYFNIRKKSFDNANLYFRFKTSDISGSPGDKTNTWASDTDILSGLSLTGDANCLIVTQAYGQKFYELASTKSIGISNFSFSVPKNPSYAFLVYALAHPDPSQTKALFPSSNQIHKFQANSDPDSGNAIYNNGYVPGNSNGSTVDQFYNVFSLSPLLSPQFISKYQQRNGLSTVNINKPLFVDNFSNWYKNNTVEASFNNRINPRPNFISNKIFDLCNTPNSLTSPTATNTPFIINQNAGDVPLSTFSLFFVEMYSYLTLPTFPEVDYYERNARYNILNIITKVNGLTCYEHKILITPELIYSNNINCKISIGNNPGSGGVRMFLFDYLHGTSRDISSMNEDKDLILDSLAYDNRKILLKSSSDLQMTNANKSLRFPANLSHPFLNMYFS